MKTQNFDHGSNVTFLVSSISTSGIQIDKIRVFQSEDDAWKYYIDLGEYCTRFWATYPDRPPKLLSTKAYMSARGTEYKL